jgi:hypothetical protein
VGVESILTLPKINADKVSGDRVELHPNPKRFGFVLRAALHYSDRSTGDSKDLGSITEEMLFSVPLPTATEPLSPKRIQSMRKTLGDVRLAIHYPERTPVFNRRIRGTIGCKPVAATKRRPKHQRAFQTDGNPRTLNSLLAGYALESDQCVWNVDATASPAGLR